MLTYDCDTSDPPATPGKQTRYMHPARCNAVGSWDATHTRFVAKRGFCDE